MNYLADRNLVGFLAHADALGLLEVHADVLAVEPVIGARLHGGSVKLIRGAVDNGVLTGSGRHRRIEVTDLAEYAGHSFTRDDWGRVAKAMNRQQSDVRPA